MRSAFRSAALLVITSCSDVVTEAGIEVLVEEKVNGQFFNRKPGMNKVSKDAGQAMPIPHFG